jgi:hypothetical protein
LFGCFAYDSKIAGVTRSIQIMNAMANTKGEMNALCFAMKASHFFTASIGGKI